MDLSKSVLVYPKAQRALQSLQEKKIEVYPAEKVIKMIILFKFY